MKYLRVSTVLISSILASGSFAVQAETGARMTELHAKSIVQEYRELRQECSDAVDAARRNCFNQLSRSNERYKDAKKRLGITKPAEEDNVRLVTFVN